MSGPRVPAASPVEGGGVLLRSDAARLVLAQLRTQAAQQLRGLGTVPAPLAMVIDTLHSALDGSGDGTSEVPARAGQAPSVVDLIDVWEAAALLGCSDSYVRRIHASLDGVKRSGRWWFDRAAVVAFREARKDT